MDNYEASLHDLVRQLVSLPHETEWLEFKASNTNKDQIGENIAAISNAAALHDKDAGFIVWGVDDSSHEIVGTNFDPQAERAGNTELNLWLANLLKPSINFTFHKLALEDSVNVVLLQIPSATHQPTKFKNASYIRIGSNTKKLVSFPEKERVLWERFSSCSFETEIAIQNISGEDVLKSIDYEAYYQLSQQPIPNSDEDVLKQLAKEKLIKNTTSRKYHITNIGAILFARDINEFDRIKRKAIRVIIYKGVDRISANKERPANLGYANGFVGLVTFILKNVAHEEVYISGLRRDVPVIPEIAIRELTANALIHQDFSMTGTGPIIEIFQDRIELTNPGKPLIEVIRFADHPSLSRNEKTAALMRQLKICEERGSGIDKVLNSIEEANLPAPKIVATDSHTKITLFGPRSPNQMTKTDKIWACLWHAALKYASGSAITNQSVRERFRIEKGNSAMATRIIKDTVEANLIKPQDPNSNSRKEAKYVPIWA
jgi:predicted HTH transcriptional regulator